MPRNAIGIQWGPQSGALSTGTVVAVDWRGLVSLSLLFPVVDDFTMVQWIGVGSIAAGVLGVITKIVVNYPLVVAVAVGAVVMTVGIYCKVRSRGLLVYLPEGLQSLLLHSSVFDLLVDRRGVTKFSRLMQRLIFIAFNPRLSEKSLRECLMGMDEDFLEKVLQPGLAHLLPRKAQKALMPPSRISERYEAPAGLPSIRIDRRMAGDIIELERGMLVDIRCFKFKSALLLLLYKRRHKPQSDSKMPPPIYRVLAIIARPTLAVVSGASLGLAVTLCCVRSFTRHVDSSPSAGILVRALTSRLCSGATVLAGGCAAATAAYKYFEDDDDRSVATADHASPAALTDRSPTYETVVPSRLCPPLLTSTYLAFHIGQRRAEN
ncbi:hypothetical protein FOZ61_004665 [Perkinsus olseni]|uniref:Uncharacterized protein n=1 Tax=Perkinsus olseni TaxID=32597 RepID=A0A7J6LK94_PEROL|nr:hypothetical protein FOZ61_004665 [Perkinsus olseni]